MAFDWREYLALAKQIHVQTLDGVSPEASARTIVSRAYYSAHCCARNFARDTAHFQVSGYGRDHMAVVRYYQQRRGWADVAIRLSNLKTWREICDYEDELDDAPTRLAAEAIEDAEYILNRIPRDY